MKSIFTWIAASSLLAALATAQPPRYTLTDLGPSIAFSQATGVNNNGLVTGLAAVPGGSQHAVIWQGGRMIDIGTPGYGGPNSGAFGANEKGQVEVQAESAAKDPNNENFCAYGTGLKCLPFVWQDGVLTPLATLGGNNGTVGGINNRGQIAGIAENGIRDPQCPSGKAVTGTGPQVLDFEAVIWGPNPGEIHPLPPLAGDTVAMAIAINDSGQAVGASGSCANTILPPLAAGPHAVLWENDGSVHDLGSLGGTINTAVPGLGNMGLAINSQGQVVGVSALRGNTSAHAFLWTKESGMRDLGTLSGDVISAGLGINERGEVIGASLDKDGNPRAFLWQNGVMTDLNTVVPTGSPLFLLLAFAINSRGQIAGFGVTSTGDVHAYLATPAARTLASAGPKNATVTARQMMLDATASTSADGKPLSYQWSIPQGSPSAAILQGNTAMPTVQFGTARGVYTFQLTVTDSTGTSVSDFATVNFQGN